MALHCTYTQFIHNIINLFVVWIENCPYEWMNERVACVELKNQWLKNICHHPFRFQMNFCYICIDVKYSLTIEQHRWIICIGKPIDNNKREPFIILKVWSFHPYYYCHHHHIHYLLCKQFEWKNFECKWNCITFAARICARLLTNNLIVHR